MSTSDSPRPPARAGQSEVHLCDNYAHLLFASADVAGRRNDVGSPRPLILFSDDFLPLADDLLTELASLSGAEIVRVSDRSAIDAFARLPRAIPAQVRRNISWTDRGRPIGPASWSPASLVDRCFDTGYVYHPGFFLSKVIAGRCTTVVMRDSGYANYVRHRVPWRRRFARLVAGRSSRFQTWGEEPWVDRIEVARPDMLPEHVRHKSSRLTLDELMHRLPPDVARSLAQAFWGDAPTVSIGNRPTALLLTQPIDQLGICTRAQKHELYDVLARRLREQHFDIVVKPHPRELEPALPQLPRAPAPFPIEAWAWLGQPPFAVAVSLNSTSLASLDSSLAVRRLQLVPRERFYSAYWNEWPGHIDEAFHRWNDVELPEPVGQSGGVGNA